MKTAVAGIAAVLVGLVAAQADYKVQCYDGLAVLVNRASTEKLGFGVLATLKDQILSAVPSSGAWYNPYPATIDNYGTSEPAGVGNLTQILKEYVDKCPCHKVALLGFSQGAQVIGDTLIGPSYPAFVGFGINSGVGQKYVDAVSSAVLFGDPAQVANLTIDAGNSTNNGIFERNNTANWANFGLVGRVKAFCQAGDFYCDKGAGADSHAIHGRETLTYGKDGVAFILQTWNNSTKNTCATTGSGSTGMTMNGTSTAGNSTASSNTTSSPGSGSSSPSASPTGSTTPRNAAGKVGISSMLVFAALAMAL